MSDRKNLGDLIDRYFNIVLPTKLKSARDARRHLNWWKEKLGKYGIQNITPDLIAKCRQELAEGRTPKGDIRSVSTINRYLAALSAVLTYGVKECGWIQDNPCLRVTQYEPRVFLYRPGSRAISQPEELQQTAELIRNNL